jgi:transcription-repair coupling factor (superfamily II helicase)
MSFPYVETEDQLRAITDISSDLAGDKPMDRLVCGDVGFGKTEVAMRATCMVVASPNHAQVLVIVPTTLLARQHYKSFCERFEGLPVKVGQLSRFVSKQEADKVKAGLADGSIDIVIGTHALLSDKIKVKNPGLIIIDEEQHFGVAQKEKIRKLKSNTHILTLSATPIPRTLQMSLTGVKELSLITTPPVDRQPVKTYVMPFDDLIISEAIKREMARGCRVFYVTPRVAYLKEIEEKLKELLPEVRAKHAHGKMSGKELDEIMNQFYDGDFEVLVSTTIIESGLDIPFANTIIIDRADMFGLAQLHQIRGRVGRSNNKAYAYLITSKGYSLNPTAVKRLEAIQSLDNLGAGFSIASHDMDIRGYGNLVGEEQSGHIKEVGIELYQSMLQEAIDNLKHDREETEIPSPTINIGLSVQIPESYIEDPSLRLSMYRKIAQLETKESLESFAAELTDRFGTPPESTEHLFSIIKIKQLAKSAGIIKIDRGEKGILITFHNNKPQNPEKLLLLATSASDRFKIRPDGKFFIQLEPGEKDIVKLIEKVLDKV